MRISPLRSIFAACCFAALLHVAALGQEPVPEPAPPPAPDAPAPEVPAAEPPAATAEAPAEGERRRGRRRLPTVVLEAGTVHPVSGSAITDGVVVIRGERIVAVGKRGEVEVPEGATVQSFPNGHLYPGLIDALTDGFTDAAVRGDGGLDGSDAVADALRRNLDRQDELIQAGITTAYVGVSSPALLRGQGVIVRPRRDGFEPWNGRERAALGLRLSAGPVPSHPLQRQQHHQQADALFEGLEEWSKAKKDHEEALKKYQKEFDEYLAFHQKKKDAAKPADKKPDEKADGKPAESAPQPAPAEGAPAGGRRRGPPREEPRREEPRRDGDVASETSGDAELERALTLLFEVMLQEPKPQGPESQEPKPAPAGGQPVPASAEKPDEKKEEGPKRPTWPKAPPRDPQKEVLQRVLDGELPLRVEAHRPDELRAALALQKKRAIPAMVLERALGAAAIAEELAASGVPVVLTDVLPFPQPKPYEAFDTTALPSVLQRHGATFAIASGSARRASALPLMAAAAVGRGLAHEHALRAITLTPAEILGVAKDTGSLQAGKFADVLICDRPLFQSDSRVLLVLSRGRVEHEVK